MLSYKAFKEKLKEKKQPIVLGICFVLVFIVGFGTGRFERDLRKTSAPKQNNYNTKIQSQSPATAGQVRGAAIGERAAEPLMTTKASIENCLVKGNISSAGKKIYHVKGGAFYNIVKPKQCFNTEKEAQDAGFVKSSR